MPQSSVSPSQFDEHVDNYNDDVLDLQQRDAQVSMSDYRMVVNDDIEMNHRRWNRSGVVLEPVNEYTAQPISMMHIREIGRAVYSSTTYPSATF